MSKDRLCVRLKVEEVGVRELKKGDFFVLVDPVGSFPAYEDGMSVHRAMDDTSQPADPNEVAWVSTSKEPILRLSWPVTRLLGCPVCGQNFDPDEEVCGEDPCPRCGWPRQHGEKK